MFPFLLVKHFPEQKSVFTTNFDKLKLALEKLDKNMTSVAGNLSGNSLIGSHPVYQYLAKGYGLEIKSVHFEPNEIPNEKQWTEMSKFISGTKPNLMFWEMNPRVETQRKLAEMNIQVSVFNPCANKPKNGDFISVMNDNFNSAARVFE